MKTSPLCQSLEAELEGIALLAKQIVQVDVVAGLTGLLLGAVLVALIEVSESWSREQLCVGNRKAPL